MTILYIPVVYHHCVTEFAFLPNLCLNQKYVPNLDKVEISGFDTFSLQKFTPIIKTEPDTGHSKF